MTCSLRNTDFALQGTISYCKSWLTHREHDLNDNDINPSLSDRVQPLTSWGNKPPQQQYNQ